MDDLFAKLVRKEISESTYLNGGKPLTLEVGARVRAKIPVGNNNVRNAKGTIRNIDKDYEILVEFDEPVGGHNGHHIPIVDSKRGWFMDMDDLELI